MFHIRSIVNDTDTSCDSLIFSYIENPESTSGRPPNLDEWLLQTWIDSPFNLPHVPVSFTLTPGGTQLPRYILKLTSPINVKERCKIIKVSPNVLPNPRYLAVQ